VVAQFYNELIKIKYLPLGSRTETAHNRQLLYADDFDQIKKISNLFKADTCGGSGAGLLFQPIGTGTAVKSFVYDYFYSCFWCDGDQTTDAESD